MEVKEKVEPTFHTKPILELRGRLYGYLNTICSYYEGILGLTLEHCSRERT